MHELSKEKRWWLEKDDNDNGLYILIRNFKRKVDGESISKGARLARKSRGVNKGKETMISSVKSFVADGKTDLIVSFTNAKDGPYKLNIERFEWNQTDVSKSLKCTDATDFAEKFQELNHNLNSHDHDDSVISSPELSVHSMEELDESLEMDNEPIASTSSSTDELSFRPSKRKIASLKLPSESLQQPAKLQKVDIAEKAVDLSLANKFIGHFSISITALDTNSGASRNVRKVDEKWKAQLKRNILKNEHNEAYQPLLLCLNVPIEDFNERNLNGYMYDVLGGQHLAICYKELFEQFPGNARFRQLWGNIYHSLTDEEALIASEMHNRTGEFRHKRTFADKVSFCREWRSKFTNIQDWKRACHSVNSDDKASIDMALKLAGMEAECYDIFLKVVALYEACASKDQVLRSKDMKIQGKPDLPPATFAAFTTLHEEDQKVLLEGILKKDISFQEMKCRAAELKKLQAIKRAFLLNTGLVSWEEATALFPEETKEENLRRWLKASFSGKNVPESFSSFIRHAIARQNAPAAGADVFKGARNSTAVIVKSKIEELSPQNVGGADLVLCLGNDQAALRKISLATRAINVTKGVPMYRLLALCSNWVSVGKAMETLGQDNWATTQVAYWHDTSVQDDHVQGTFTDVVKPFVMCFWTPTGVQSEDFVVGEGRSTLWSAEGETEFFKQVVASMTTRENTVLSCYLKGTATTAALEEGRDTIALVASEEEEREFKTQMYTVNMNFDEE